MKARWKKYLHDLRTLPSDLRAGWLHDGRRGLWDAVASRSVHRVIRRGRLVVYSQPVSAVRDVPPPAGVTLRRLTEADWPSIERLVTARDFERFHTLHEHGHACTVAWRGNQPIGYAWVALHMEPAVSQCPLPLPPHAAYLWDLYVAPAERSNGIGSALASARLRLAREQGRTEGWRMIDGSNHASNRTLAKSGGGTRVIGVMKFTKLFSRMRGQFQPATDGSGVTA